MDLVIYRDVIDKNIGVKFEERDEYLLYVKRLIDELVTDNKNYNNRQYFKLLEVKEILDNMEIVYE